MSDQYFKEVEQRVQNSRAIGRRNQVAVQQRKFNVMPVAPAERSVEEELGDITLQKQQAMENAKKLFRGDVALNFVTGLNDSELPLFNQVTEEFGKEVRKYKGVDQVLARELFDRFLLRFESSLNIDVTSPETARFTRALSFLPAETVRGFTTRLTADDVEGVDPKAFGRFVAGYEKQIVQGKTTIQSLLQSFVSGSRGERPRMDTEETRRVGQLEQKGKKRRELVDWFENSLPEIQQKINERDIIPSRIQRLRRQGNAARGVDAKQLIQQRIEDANARLEYLNQMNLDEVMQDTQRALVEREDDPDDSRFVRGGNGMPARETVERHVDFGKYKLHVPSLHKNVLNIKYKSLVAHPKLPRRAISDDLKEVLLDALEEGNVNPRLVSKLEKEDKKLLGRVLEIAKVANNPIVVEDDVEEMKRFELLRGQVLAGNDNPDIQRELKALIFKFLDEGRLKKAQANKVMLELMTLS